ncbi:PREDICTED: mitogen-activated protein kinase kinase kinase 15-like [Thamnophis sirtalis]|uniref:mitogen-activated protein kinase kinase kinase n=1 Tax=Thamnophis sirtalis TaxID=35019 RepID=A0A6I9YW74_9SAUR|nr:PREDICTED: mitogen-activated protein kinase kinase kinase 15-like [Thamnophis sirtalis]
MQLLRISAIFFWYFFDGYIKIFMEQVPGGSLSALLRSKWGPMKEPTIKFYAKQILEGLKYLHENQIVHRDIKGDNVLINTYSGVVKISDFGTSKRLAGVNPCTETFTGTLQYMAPEIIDKGPRGYGAPADIWSLGCTIIEMSTGRAPFHELGEPQAAMFKVGMFKIHPEIPESLSAEAKAFILLCFEPDPNKRVTASDLLKDSFLKQVNKGKKSRIAFKPSDYNRSASLPLPVHGEQVGSSSSEPGSVSPDSDVQSDMLFEKAKRSLSEIQSKSPLSHLLSVPDESSIPDERNSSPSFEEKDSGLFLLRKDSERRAILYKILKDEQNQVASNLQDCVAQSSEELRLSVAHIKQIIGILRDFIHSPEHRIMASTISKLKMDLDFDNTSINQIQLVLFGFQDAVNKVLRNHLIKPHWMFAMDNIIRHAVQAAITILIPELRTHFEPASETEVDKEANEIEEDYQQGRPEESVTAEGCTLTSSQSPDTEEKLNLQLNKLKQRTNRLLENLIQREREYQTLLQQTLQQKNQDLQLLQLQLNTREIQPLSPALQHNIDEELTKWLKQQRADSDAIDRFVQEDYTLSDVLNSITKEDLQLLRLRGGLVCRIWNAILKHRKQNAVLGMED